LNSKGLVFKKKVKIIMINQNSIACGLNRKTTPVVAKGKGGGDRTGKLLVGGESTKGKKKEKRHKQRTITIGDVQRGKKAGQTRKG